MTNFASVSNLLVFSSDRFASVQVRTTRLMAEFGQHKNVFFVEEPLIGLGQKACYLLQKHEQTEITIIQPYLPANLSVFERRDELTTLIKEFLTDESIEHYAIWADTPKSMPFIRYLNPEIIIYDCLLVDGLYHELEQEMLEYADVVLTSRTQRNDFSVGLHLVTPENQTQQWVR